MVGMSIVAQALTNRRLAKESPVIALLRSPLMPVVLGFIAEHFPHGAGARPVADIYELFDADLRLLRSEDFELPKNAQAYVNDWVKAEWLVRKPGTSRTGETVEPSENSLIALDAVQRWDQPRSAVTASRIQAIAQALENLARDSDPDASTRLEQLEKQRAHLDKLIEATHKGDFHVLNTADIRERIIDILDLAATVPADFARVRGEFEQLNRRLRRQLLEPEENRGDVLEDIFSGVDVIADSEAGRSFHGFYNILLDREQSAHIDACLDSILERENTKPIELEFKERLRRLFRDMETSGYEVNAVMTSLARSLRHYVTTQDFAESRRMIALLRHTRALASRAVERANLGPLHQLSTPLTKIGMNIASIDSLKLKNPGEEFVENEPTTIAAAEINTEMLLESVRASEIDFAELETAVTTSVNRRGSATIAEVLKDNPAKQGLASVVGLLYLAMTTGESTDTLENITWIDGEIEMSATITGWCFNKLPEIQ